MNIHSCFNRVKIGNLGSGNFELLINNQLIPLFTLPDPRTSVHDRNNWLYDRTEPKIPPPTLETPQIYDHLDSFLSDEETDPETPPFYHHFLSPDHADSNTFAALIATPPPIFDQAPAINALQPELDFLRDELIILRIKFHSSMGVVA